MFNVGYVAFKSAGLWGDWRPGVAVGVAVSAGLLGAATGLVRRTVRREGGVAGAAAPVEGLPEVAPGATPGRTPASREVGDRAVLWRELRQPLIGSRRGAAWAVLATAVLVVAVSAVAGRDVARAETQAVFAFGYQFVGWLLAAVLGATCVAQEKEGDTWSALIAAPVSGGEVVWGKALGAVARLKWPAALVVGHFTAFWLLGLLVGDRSPRYGGREGLSLVAAVLMVWTVLATNAVWVATGVWLSVRLSRPTTAVVANLALGLGLYVALPLVLGGLTLATADRDGHLVQLWAWSVPYVQHVVIVENFVEWRGRADAPWPLGNNVPPAVLLGAVVAVGGLYLAAGGLVLGRAASTFDRVVGRAGSGGASAVAPARPSRQREPAYAPPH